MHINEQCLDLLKLSNQRELSYLEKDRFLFLSSQLDNKEYPVAFYNEIKKFEKKLKEEIKSPKFKKADIVFFEDTESKISEVVKIDGGYVYILGDGFSSKEVLEDEILSPEEYIEKKEQQLKELKESLNIT